LAAGGFGRVGRSGRPNGIAAGGGVCGAGPMPRVAVGNDGHRRLNDCTMLGEGGGNASPAYYNSFPEWAPPTFAQPKHVNSAKVGSEVLA